MEQVEHDILLALAVKLERLADETIAKEASLAYRYASQNLRISLLRCLEAITK